jgi:hypothetical protein
MKDGVYIHQECDCILMLDRNKVTYTWSYGEIRSFDWVTAFFAVLFKYSDGLTIYLTNDQFIRIGDL